MSRRPPKAHPSPEPAAAICPAATPSQASRWLLGVAIFLEVAWIAALAVLVYLQQR